MTYRNNSSDATFPKSARIKSNFDSTTRFAKKQETEKAHLYDMPAITPSQNVYHALNDED